MKALVLFEIEDTGNIEQDKELLIQKMADLMEDWIKGEGVINVEFIQTYETDNEVFKGFWTTDSTIN